MRLRTFTLVSLTVSAISFGSVATLALISAHVSPFAALGMGVATVCAFLTAKGTGPEEVGRG